MRVRMQGVSNNKTLVLLPTPSKQGKEAIAFCC